MAFQTMPRIEMGMPRRIRFFISRVMNTGPGLGGRGVKNKKKKPEKIEEIGSNCNFINFFGKFGSVPWFSTFEQSFLSFSTPENSS